METEVIVVSGCDGPMPTACFLHRETRGPAYAARRREKGRAHITCPSRSPDRPRAINALGGKVTVRPYDGQIHVPVSTTPVVVAPGAIR